jgi:hypothetical protein
VAILSAGTLCAEPRELVVPKLAQPFADPFPPAEHPGEFCQPAESVVFQESFEKVSSSVPGVVGNAWKGRPEDKLPIVYPLPEKLRKPPTALSIEWWMKLEAGTRPNGTLIHGPGWKISFSWNEGEFGTLHVKFQEAKQGAWIGAVGPDMALTRPDGQWHHYAATFDLHTTTLYVDSEIVRRNWEGNNAEEIGPMADGSNETDRNDIAIGGNSGGRWADFAFHSVPVDELRVSTVALTAWQVRRNFENCRTIAKNIFVSPTGTDDVSGEQTHPLSLKSALAQCGPGIRITLLPGKYNGADFVVEHGGVSPLQEAMICGLPGSEPAVITAENETGARISSADFLTIRNVTFVGGKTALTVDHVGRHVTLDACRIAARGDGIAVSNSPGIRIQNSIVNTSGDGTGVRISASPENLLKNNTIVNGAVGIAYAASEKLLLLNNILSRQSKTCLSLQEDSLKAFAGDGNIYDPGNGSAAMVGETTFAREKFDAFRKKLYESDPVLKKNDKLHAYAPEHRSYALHVEFADEAAGDFRLKSIPGNPIDCAVETTAQRPGDPPPSDACGAPRIQCSGAFESTPPLKFSFKLERASTTSAGVYGADGTLIRALWSARELTAGENVAFWNGLDDSNRPAREGTYQIKVLAHHMKYVWEGVIGNTSAALNGPSVHSAFLPIQSMAFVGTSGFYVPGYNEMGLTQFRFDTKNPQALTAKLGSPDYKRAFNLTATDGNWVYFADTNPPGLVVAYDVATNAYAKFSAGKQFGHWNGIEVGGKAGISGLAVQKTGNLLFVAHGGENKIFIYDKRSGTGKGSIDVSTPGRIATAANGDLWVCCQSDGKPAVVRYSNFENGAKIISTISELEAPAAVGVSPLDDGVLIADGGASQQLRAYDASGKSLWTYGQRGGYDNGPAVTTDKFFFKATMIAFQPDGTFWVKDEATHRVLHFTPDRKYLDAIMYQPHPFTQTVDPNDPTRAFINWLEFKIDYSKPLTQPGAWKLVNYWGHKLPASAYNNFDDGLYRVVTLENSAGVRSDDKSPPPQKRTYGFILGGQYGAKKIVELLPSGLRICEGTPLEGKIRLEDDGALSWVDRRDGVASFYRRDLAPFLPGSSDLRWEAPRIFAQAPAHWDRKTEVGERWDGGDPVCGDMYFAQWRYLPEAKLLVSFDCDRNSAGWHLGAVRERDNQWLWRAAPAGPMDGHGTFDTNVEYAGRSHVVSGRNIFFNLHGEFWHGGQANQFFDYLDNGLFVGQFGQPNVYGVGSDQQQSRVPGGAGNSFCISAVRVGDQLYLYHNDENGHGGSQRWRIDGWNDIQEMSGEVKIENAKP